MPATSCSHFGSCQIPLQTSPTGSAPTRSFQLGLTRGMTPLNQAAQEEDGWAAAEPLWAPIEVGSTSEPKAELTARRSLFPAARRRSSRSIILCRLGWKPARPSPCAQAPPLPPAACVTPGMGQDMLRAPRDELGSATCSVLLPPFARSSGSWPPG